ncbi:asparagine synthase (glutamine-hydrolyzing) [Sulfoacidibacillus thermotolerans]|uniref:asparagine synthase (glutamine-hydrolyzing) n=1 Tax=Sulfoacidibacillus thermotolerans TaxID=1765684 RepID=A0A2U3DC35_SULT2|nr:asparagine synthase (glutamine-hydrolyzing) [Sulfoacidibacillus thermotolerans]PWI58805.1 asparagine synthase (glutamine-hydrolyzing) [Sulfoacidibacillus thermotolerans]
MCGIVGFLNRRGQACDTEIIHAMNGEIVHRGPDDAGYYFDGSLGLGFRRLAIIDLKGGHQPLTNEDESIWIVFNGEIYNYKDLRDELIACGHSFKTETDTEVIIHLYEEYGVECVSKLRGMFAFGIWDGKKEQLFLARDLFGIKPLYYTYNSDFLAFSSEIKSLLKIPGISREIDREAFWNYLTFQYVPEPMTMFEGIWKLPPAHYLIARGNEVVIKRYYQLAFTPIEQPVSYFVEGVLEQLRESVRVHMNSDVPRGAFLSSGVDSSAIVALLKELEEVQTFTVGFEGAGGLSEIEYARETARVLGTVHRDTVISAKRYLEELPRLVYHQDEPVADPSAIALYFVSELASEHVTVVLSGEGADEIFGGYTIYREPLSLRVFDYLPPSMRQGLGDVAQIIPEGMKGRSFLMRGSKTVEQRFFGNAFLFSEAEKRKFVKFDPEKLGYGRPTDLTGRYYQQVQDADDVTKMQYLDLHTWLPGDILMKADKMTMANSVELRVPFLDRQVFEFASKIPAAYRLANGTTKYVLREAVRKLLPKEVTERKKLGFPVPTRKWLRDEHYQFAREIIGSSTLDDLFDKDYVLHLLEEHRQGVRDHARKIWAIVIFLLWHQIFVVQSQSFISKESELVAKRRHRMFVEEFV